MGFANQQKASYFYPINQITFISEEDRFIMEDFIVSARKYRPASFDTVVGQLSITSTLRNAILNRQLAQAYLFTGPRGVGKQLVPAFLLKQLTV